MPHHIPRVSFALSGLDSTARFPVLSKDQEELSRQFAGRPQEGLQVPFVWHEGYPLIKGAIAYVTCQVIDIHPAGDHTLYIGQVEHLGSVEEQAPLLFYRGKYH